MSYNIVQEDGTLKKIAGLSKLNVWTGTQSDYNAQKNTIPNGSYVNITDDAESGNGIKDIYSTDEVKTNKVWIDGKPIYRKIINTIATNELDVSNLNIDKLININGYVEHETYYIYINSYWDSTWATTMLYNYSEKKFHNLFGSSTLNRPIVMILEYTKTS